MSDSIPLSTSRSRDLVSSGFSLVDGVDLYLKKINTISILSEEEEHALAERFFKENDVDAARQLVIGHLRFVAYIARSYMGYGLSYGDLIQEGNVGLMKAVKRFDPSYGVRLISFAVHWIKAEIHEFILRNWRIVKVATTKAQRKLFFSLRGRKKHLGWLTKLEADAIAEDLDVPAETVLQMEKRMLFSDAPFDTSSSNSEEDDGSLAPYQYLESSDNDPETAYLEDERKAKLSNLGKFLESLDERSRDILYSRWLQDTKKTLSELANKYGVSVERVRQIEANALKKLKGIIPNS